MHGDEYHIHTFVHAHTLILLSHTVRLFNIRPGQQLTIRYGITLIIVHFISFLPALSKMTGVAECYLLKVESNLLK